MDGWKALRAPDQSATLVQRIRHRVMMYLLARLLRFVGWGAVVGLPGMVFGSRRVAGIARRYPIAIGTLCIGGLIGLTLWNENSHSQPTRFEIEPIDHFDDPTVLLAQSKSSKTSPADGSDAESETPPRQNVDIQSGVGARVAETHTQPVVWLTGHIEELPAGTSQSPVRNAVRFLPNRQ